MRLKGGQETEDTRLDRVIQFDERSRNFPIRAAIPIKPRSYSWQCSSTLDQGREGACVGFSWTHELIARPKPIPELTDSFALQVYRRARQLDEWPGENYDGTSVIAGAKALKELGYISEYRWAFGLEDLILALGYKGPAVLGIPWYESMYETDGVWVRVDGDQVGGHAILARGVSIPGRYVTLHNSWGPDWGLNGDARISFDDLDRLLNEDGEACVPVIRKRV